jgi:hypothetical protein
MHVLSFICRAIRLGGVWKTEVERRIRREFYALVQIDLTAFS